MYRIVEELVPLVLDWAAVAVGALTPRRERHRCRVRASKRGSTAAFPVMSLFSVVQRLGTTLYPEIANSADH